MNFVETSLQANTHNTRKKISTSKADLESKLQAINELKIKSEILESEINKINEEVSQKNIEDLLREVLTLENGNLCRRFYNMFEICFNCNML